MPKPAFNILKPNENLSCAKRSQAPPGKYVAHLHRAPPRNPHDDRHHLVRTDCALPALSKSRYQSFYRLRNSARKTDRLSRCAAYDNRSHYRTPPLHSLLERARKRTLRNWARPCGDPLALHLFLYGSNSQSAQWWL